MNASHKQPNDDMQLLHLFLTQNKKPSCNQELQNRIHQVITEIPHPFKGFPTFAAPDSQVTNKALLAKLSEEYRDVLYRQSAKWFQETYHINPDDTNQNIIDMRQFWDYAANDPLIDVKATQWLTQHPEFEPHAYQPAFPTGVFLISAKWSIHYRTIWKSNEKHLFEITYFVKEEKHWMPDIQLTVSVKNNGRHKIKQHKTLPDLYKDIQIPEWNDMDKNMFQRTIAYSAQTQDKEQNYQDKTTTFLGQIYYLNWTLACNQKPKKDKNPSQPSEQPQTIHLIVPADKTEPVKKSLQIRIQTKESPKLPPRCQTNTDEPRCIHYETPSWQVRGHIRRYKSGKTVYIKPTVRHRKNMNQDTPAKPVHLTIQKPDMPK